MVQKPLQKARKKLDDFHVMRKAITKLCSIKRQGGLAEWSIAHVWNTCVRQRTAGSNPVSSELGFSSYKKSRNRIYT